MLLLELCKCSSDFSPGPADHVPDWQPGIFLGMVEAPSVLCEEHNINNLRGEILFLQPMKQQFYTHSGKSVRTS